MVKPYEGHAYQKICLRPHRDKLYARPNNNSRESMGTKNQKELHGY